MRTLVIGDVHGQVKQLKKVLEAANVTREDLVIQLGDVVDRGDEPFKCMQVLYDLPHVVLVRGNHDAAFGSYTRGQRHPLDGHHGSYVTMGKWRIAESNMQTFVKIFLKEQVPYYIDRHNFCYVHAGFNTYYRMDEQHETMLLWDRDMWKRAMHIEETRPGEKLITVEGFKKIFIGHTPTIIYDKEEPMYAAGVWNIDTGCGKGGKLTIMDVETEQFWQA